MSPIARAGAISLTGLQGEPIMVEATVSQQLPGMAIIGLPDAALAEAKLRVKLGVRNSGFTLSDRFITVNLSPAAIPKHGSGFDLAIALAVLAASGLSLPGIDRVAHIGELALDGTLRRPVGLLGLVLNAHRHGFETVIVPVTCRSEASLVSGLRVIAVEGIQGAVNWYTGVSGGWHEGDEEAKKDDINDRRGHATIDMSEVVGQPDATEALTVAAAGRHHLTMVGPPGAGKSMLAARLPTILPDLNEDESIEVSTIASLITARPLERLIRRPPFEAPHHTATATAIIGGGQGGIIQPGAITRASRGVLFLDEAAEFPARVLDALRQPLERGVIDIHRAHVRATLPAHVQLLLASNPCPCGYAGSVGGATSCVCTPHAKRRYSNRISGPLSDRIDLRVTVNRVARAALRSLEKPMSSETLRERVIDARAAAAERLRRTPWNVNGDVPGPWLRENFRLGGRATEIIDRALTLGRLTLRGYDRVLRVAWTVGDLAGRVSPGRDEIARALTFRESDAI